MRVFTVLETIVLISIIMNETLSACRFLKLKGSYMRGFLKLRQTGFSKPSMCQSFMETPYGGKTCY